MTFPPRRISGRTRGRSSGLDGELFARDPVVGGSGQGFGESRIRPRRHRGGDEGHDLGNKLYVGNIPFTATEDELRALFEQHGAVQSVSVITDRETGRPRGFAFVEFQESSGAEAALQALNGVDLGGRPLRVNEAFERERGGGGGGARGGRGGGGGGGYGGGRPR